MSLPSDPSVFDILNLFCRQWFLSRDWLVSNVTSAQRTDSLSIDWVEFPPVAHTHLVQCAIKLAPSVPAAKVKQVMFVYLLEVLNGDGPVLSFFAPHRAHTPCKRRTRKPRVGGDQPVGAMAIDAPSPVAPSQPDPPGSLSPGLVPGNGDPSSEEPAGDGFNVTSGQASPTPSDRTVMPFSPLRLQSPLDDSCPPSVLGVKQSPLPASPSPPSSPPPIPSSPLPHVGTQKDHLLQDWWEWIADRRRLAGRVGKSFHATGDDLLEAGRLRLNMESALLWQVENTGPLAPVASPSPLAPVIVGNPCYNSITQSATFDLLHNSTLRYALLGWHPNRRFKWLQHNHLPPDHPIPPP